jgi:hypothetical protein
VAEARGYQTLKVITPIADAMIFGSRSPSGPAEAVPHFDQQHGKTAAWVEGLTAGSCPSPVRIGVSRGTAETFVVEGAATMS